MTKSNYSQLLLDPRWQKKRLEILSRDEFVCQRCFVGNSTLHVHHCYYNKGTPPWEYPSSSLVTLCKDCHDTESQFFYEQKNYLTDVLSSKGFLSEDFNDLACLFRDMTFPHYRNEVTLAAIRYALRDPKKLLDSYFKKVIKDGKAKAGKNA